MRYRFDDCELRIDSHELYVGGELRAIEPQVFDLLRHLVGKAGELVTQDELVDVVWGGRVVSDSAISARISAARAAIGDDGTHQRLIKTVPRRGFRFLSEVEINDGPQVQRTELRKSTNSADIQKIRFCVSRDGTQIAFATTGAGQPLVRAGHGLTHLEHDWRSPLWRPFLDELGNSFRVTRYDQRGNGLSDWKVKDFSFEAFVDDLEAVVNAAGLDRFALYGTSQGAPIAIGYAARHPERVTHLILHGGYQRGRLIRGDQEEREQGEAILTLIRHGWGKPGSPFIQAFSSMYIPNGAPEQISSLTELQRLSTSPDNAALLRAAVDSFDVSKLLHKLQAPTLVIHARDDGVHPLDEGRKLSAGIKNSEFLMLDSANHAPVQNEPAWDVFFHDLRSFVLE